MWAALGNTLFLRPHNSVTLEAYEVLAGGHRCHGKRAGRLFYSDGPGALQERNELLLTGLQSSSAQFRFSGLT